MMNATPQSLTHIAAGSPWWVYAIVIAGLVLHIGGGSIAILSGYAAVAVPKGERLHRLFGTLFFWSMLVMSIAATSLAIWLLQTANIAAGVLAFYLVTTSWATVRRPEGTTGVFEKIALVAIIGVSLAFLTGGILAKMSPHGGFQGFAAIFYFVFAGITAFLAVLDLKVIRNGGISGAPRIARHLWRMCFGFFFAAGSFFLGQQKVMPVWMHGSPVLYVLALAPLLFLIFWMIRVRLTGWYKAPAAVA